MERLFDDFDLQPIADELRRTRSAPEAEQMIWAFECALEVGRVDPDLLDHLLAATVCLVAARTGCTPRDVLESFFRRSVPDGVWTERYLPLFA